MSLSGTWSQLHINIDVCFSLGSDVDTNMLGECGKQLCSRPCPEENIHVDSVVDIDVDMHIGADA